MEMSLPVVDAQQLYRQWQEGRLLDNDERNALRNSTPDPGKPLFADMLRSASERDS